MQLQDAVQQRFRGGRAARHVHVHRHDTVAAAHHGVGVVVVAAAVGAGAHRDHPARIGHLVIDLAQRRRHLVAQGACHDHHVGLTWRRTEHETETLQVVTGSTSMHHLHRTASQTERHRVHRTRTRPVDYRVKGSGDEAFVKYAFNRHGLFPIKGTFLPDIPKTDHEFGDEHHHRHVTLPAQFTHGDAPWEEECSFKVEQNEQNCDEVVTHVEFHARVFESFEAALEWGELGRIGLVRAKDMAEHLRGYADAKADEKEQQDGEVIFEVHDG